MIAKLTPYLLILSLASCLAACNSQRFHKNGDHGNGPGTGTETESDETKEELQAKERELHLGDANLEKLKVEMKMGALQADHAVKKAETQLKISKAGLHQFTTLEVPLRIEESSNEIDYLRDELRSQEEELEQLEMMYAEDDLGDKTKEIVLERSRRSLALKRADLALHESKHDFLVNHTIPMETKEMKNDCQEAELDLLEAKLGLKLNKLEAKADLMEAENALQELKEEIEKLKKEVE